MRIAPFFHSLSIPTLVAFGITFFAVPVKADDVYMFVDASTGSRAIEISIQLLRAAQPEPKVYVFAEGVSEIHDMRNVLPQERGLPAAELLEKLRDYSANNNDPGIGNRRLVNIEKLWTMIPEEAKSPRVVVVSEGRHDPAGTGICAEISYQQLALKSHVLIGLVHPSSLAPDCVHQWTSQLAALQGKLKFVRYDGAPMERDGYNEAKRLLNVHEARYEGSEYCTFRSTEPTGSEVGIYVNVERSPSDGSGRGSSPASQQEDDSQWTIYHDHERPHPICGTGAKPCYVSSNPKGAEVEYKIETPLYMHRDMLQPKILVWRHSDRAAFQEVVPVRCQDIQGLSAEIKRFDGVALDGETLDGFSIEIAPRFSSDPNILVEPSILQAGFSAKSDRDLNCGKSAQSLVNAKWVRFGCALKPGEWWARLLPAKTAVIIDQPTPNPYRGPNGLESVRFTGSDSQPLQPDKVVFVRVGYLFLIAVMVVAFGPITWFIASHLGKLRIAESCGVRMAPPSYLVILWSTSLFLVGLLSLAAGFVSVRNFEFEIALPFRYGAYPLLISLFFATCLAGFVLIYAEDNRAMVIAHLLLYGWLAYMSLFVYGLSWLAGGVVVCARVVLHRLFPPVEPWDWICAVLPVPTTFHKPKNSLAVK